MSQTQQPQKAMSLAALFEAELHRSFTVRADDLFASGFLTREERIALSGCIGSALDAFSRAMEDRLGDARFRSPYTEVPYTEAKPKPVTPVTMPEMDEPVGGAEMKKFDPNQPRAEDRKWTSGSGSQDTDSETALKDALKKAKDTKRMLKAQKREMQKVPKAKWTDDIAESYRDTLNEIERLDDEIDDLEEQLRGGKKSVDTLELPFLNAHFRATRSVYNVKSGDTVIEVPTYGDAHILPDSLAIKALKPDRVGAYLCLWGNPEMRDVVGEFFTVKTEELDAIFKAIGKIPAIYHHAMDDAIKTTVVGEVDVMQFDDVGLWVEAQIRKADTYRNLIAPLIDQKVLGWSSGTLPGARRVNQKTGEILRWPIVEASMTPTPAEWRMAAKWPVQALGSIYRSIAGGEAGAELERLFQLALEQERLRLLELSFEV